VLDPRSIVFILAALSLLMAIVLSAMPSAVRDRQQGARHWSASMLCVALASVLYGLRDMVPESLSMVVANASAMGATALIYYGGRAFFEQRRHGRQLIIALLIANLGLVYCLYVQDLYAIRVVIFSSVSGVLLFLFTRNRARPISLSVHGNHGDLRRTGVAGPHHQRRAAPHRR
jgi:drug/metabolite transporter (DMT)-like permease